MKLIYLDNVDSTNLWAKQNANRFNEDILVYTDNQTAGYGRFGRDWCSPKGSSLAFSLLLSPPIDIAYWPNCSQVVAVVVASYFADNLGLRPCLKWPNDILFDNKKAVGILAETTQLGNLDKRLIVGVGINVKQNIALATQVAKPIVSLEEMGVVIDVQSLIKNLQPLIQSSLVEYYQNGFQSFANVWRILGEDIGRKVYLHNGNNSLEGFISAVNDDGSLCLSDTQGYKHTISSGEIEYLSSKKDINDYRYNR